MTSTDPALVATLNALLELGQGDPKFCARIMDEIQGAAITGPRQVEDAVRAWRDGDAVKTAQLMHTLRGSFGAIGAKQFSATTREIEQAIHGGAVDQLDSLFERAQGEIVAAVAEIQTWLKQANPTE